MVAGMIIFISFSGFGALKTWVPTTGGSWAIASNWNPSSVPVAGDYVSIPNDQINPITNVPTISLDTMHVSGTCTLTGAGSPETITVTAYLYVHSGKTLRLGNGNRINFILASTAKGNIQGTVTIYSGTTNRYFRCEGDLSMALNGLINNSGESDFILTSGATLRIFSTAGITTVGTAAGNIQTTGSRQYNSAANYVYDGVNAQNTGTGLPTNLTGQLLISNTAGVTLVNANRNITTGTLYLYRGTFTINPSGNQRLYLGNGATVIRRDGSINSTGVLQGTGTYDVNYISTSKTSGPELLNTGLRNVTVNLDAGQTLTSATTAFSVTNDLTIQQGTLDLQAVNANYTVGNDLTVVSGATLKHSVYWRDTPAQYVLLSVGGDLLIDGAYDYSAVPRTHVQMSGTGIKYIRTPNTAMSIFSLVEGNYYASGAITINDNFWPMIGSTAGSFHTNGYTVTANATLLNNGGTVYVDGGTLSVTGGMQIGAGTNGACVISSGTLNADDISLGDGTRTGTITHSGGTANIGNLTIYSTSGNAYTCSGSPAINVSGNWTNNRSATAFTPASSTVTFNGTAGQSIGGSFNTPFYNLAISNTGGAVAFGAATGISNNFSIATGATADLGTGLSHTAGTLTMGGAGRINGTWGHSSSAATHENDIYFADSTGIVTVGTSTCTAPIFGYSKADVSCYGGSDGSITVTVSSGVPNYEFSKDGGSTWTTPQASNEYTFGSLTASGGPYIIVVRDGSGCVQTECP